MEDGNVVGTADDKHGPNLTNLYSDLSTNVTSNGHEAPTPRDLHTKPTYERSQEDKFRRRINPLKIHLGKRPFVDNSLQYPSAVKRKPLEFTHRISEANPTTRTPVPRIVPRLAPKKVNRNQFHNVSSRASNIAVDPGDGKPVPRLVPKSQLSQYKKSKNEKSPQLNEYTEYLGLQPMVKFKCVKCYAMFPSIIQLREHQQVCRAQVSVPTPIPEVATSVDTNSEGPTRVTKKVYLCSACGTYYENWNLFLHMREVHNRHICLFCLGMFSKAEELSSHLTNKHNVTEYSYDTKDDFLNVYNGTFYLMCCTCEEIYSEKDEFFSHDCNNVKPKPKPVPVLVSKNAARVVNTKQTHNHNDTPTNGPVVAIKEPASPHIAETSKCDIRKDISEVKIEKVPPLSIKIPPMLRQNNNISSNNDNIPIVNKQCNETLDMKENSLTDSPIFSPACNNQFKDESAIKCLPTVVDPTPPPMVVEPLIEEKVNQRNETPDKEKDCGIKLKLSLNNATKSPVIINSTVDPTVGRQNANKPPPRVRRPPKRYEKETTIESLTPSSTPTTPYTISYFPQTPTIKMTICDKSDSPFVKTTIIEDKEDPTTKLIINNNFETKPKPIEKTENVIKSTIYDTQPEDINTLNRVPKLTVRVPKELLDKDSSSDYSSDSDVSDRLTVDEKETVSDKVSDSGEKKLGLEQEIQPAVTTPPVEEPKQEIVPPIEDFNNGKDNEDNGKDSSTMEATENVIKEENETEIVPTETTCNEPEKSVKPLVTDEIPVTELALDKPLDKYPIKDLLKVFLSSTIFNCIYCNHVRKIAVNCEQLCLHMVAQHRFAATVDSITAEELLPETITAKVRIGAVELSSVYMNLESYDSVDKCEKVLYDQLYECFQCYFKTPVHKDLYLHNRKMHQKTILLCVMCKTNFYSYSELLCHLCPGTYDSDNEIRFRCYVCNLDTIPSSFRLMVHLRKVHHTCDVCLEYCYNQSRLSNHVWKHKLHHLCYRCGIAYRNKPDITKHLFWKHGTESVMCKKCLQKKWPHVYHFCIPPAVFVCDECTLTFTKAVCLKVHKRFHAEEYPHICEEEGCTEKFVSKKLLTKHVESHKQPTTTEIEAKEQNTTIDESKEESKDVPPVIDLVDDTPVDKPGAQSEKSEKEPEPLSKKAKKKKLKDLLLDVNLPALNLSESDSSDESDSGQPPTVKDEKPPDTIENEPKSELPEDVLETKPENVKDNDVKAELELDSTIPEEKTEQLEDEKPSEQQVLDIWDNFKKYQAKVEKVKTPPLVPIRKHVCESDHDYCLIPTDLNGDDDLKKLKKSPKKRRSEFSSSSSSSSDSDSSCSCGSNCSCSSSSGSSSSSSSDSDSSDSGREMKKKRQHKKSLPNRRNSCGSKGSAVDVMGMADVPVMIPEKLEPPVAETDLETDESETDEEFYDEYPQRLANKLLAEKRNQLLMLASVAPSDNGSMSGDVSRSTTPVKDIAPPKKEKSSSSKKKAKKKKKSKSSKKTSIKLNIPKQIISNPETDVAIPSPIAPNKITISLQSNTVQIPETPVSTSSTTPLPNTSTRIASQSDSKRASKRRRVPNKFYGYSSDEDTPQQLALKPQLPPKLEWRKEDLPSPTSHKPKKEVPSSTISRSFCNYTEPIRLIAPIPDPEPPRILMNTESMESSDSDSSNEGALEIYQPSITQHNSIPEPPAHLNSGTSSLLYPFVRPPVRQAREGESVYCYCRCPYDEVSEMIACDADGCPIEWFHFECVGIMVPPKGKWYCPECRKKQSYSGFR